ncbi:ABC transporter ATP-binding protein [Halomarina ordinaria]|uniref:Probable branched-chain amino acid transport ATP-binding protein LivG n=1 Tax=Halomarina ordinaria TaxID=3033939 RepID=A0ABD5UDL3_9EURY|nr:ABC transporter ATP-binding protein [Halomarina sp. PSRA2]
MNGGDTILRVENLRKQFDGIVAVDDVTAEFRRDELHAIIGPNGAGKTTFFNLLTGALSPTSGTIVFEGEDITHAAPSEIARRGLIRSYQVTKLFDGLTVLENVAIAVQSRENAYNFWGATDPAIDERAYEILEQVDLTSKADSLAENLSHGEQRTLEIAVALGTEPKLLLLDEPTSGMSPEETREVIGLVGDLRTEFPIILIEHKMSVVNEVADRILVLHNGRKLADDRPEVVKQDEEVRRVYLGGTA